MGPPAAAVEAVGLTRRFGSFTAVDGISFRVERGAIFGLLGANGAGKSTTIRMLCGLLASSAGTAHVAGFDINTEPERVKSAIGYMSQRFSLYQDLTVRENIQFFGGVYGLPRRVLDERQSWAVRLAGLAGREDSLTGTLAGGWRQRLALGCAILHRPSILFLDEPTAGVDPLSRRDFWELINRLAAEGTTVLVTTHYLDEAEYCNRILLIHAGHIVAEGSPAQLKQSGAGVPTLELACPRCLEALQALQGEPWVREAALFGASIHLQAEPGMGVEEVGRRVAGLLAGRGIRLERLEPISPSLEDVFIRLIEAQ